MSESSLDPEDYPTRQDLIRAGAIALGLGLVGFIFTFTLFVKPDLKKRQLAGVDRNAAEHSLPQAYRDHGSQQGVLAIPYSSGGWSGSKLRKSPLEIKKPERAVAVVQAPRPTATPSSLPLPGEQVGRRERPVSNRPKTVAIEQPGATSGAIRPGEVSLNEAWQRVQGGWVVMGDSLNPSGEGVLLEDRLVLTSFSAFQASGGRGFLAGQPFAGHLVASDNQQDLALLQLDGAIGLPVPICPEGTGSGQALIVGDLLRPGQFQEVCTRGAAGSYLGYFGRSISQGGQPLFNNRGELAAIGVAGHSWESHSWNLAVPSPQLASFFRDRPKSSGPVLSGSERWAAALAGRVSAVSERSTPSRANSKVLAGQALGNYPLGLSEAQLRQELGNGSPRNFGPITEIFYSGPQLTFTLVSGVVVAIDSNYNFYRYQSWSPEGTLGVDNLRSQLPDLVTCLMPAGRLSACSSGIEFILEGNKLTRLRVVPP